MGLERLLSKRVQIAGLDIGFELPIPSLGVESSKPLSQPGQLFVREVLDLLLDSLNVTHGKSIGHSPREAVAVRLLGDAGALEFGLRPRIGSLRKGWPDKAES